MATPSIEWWLVRWLQLLLLLPLIHLSASSRDEDAIGNSFNFTQEVYNATIMENSLGKTYVTPLSKMGIYFSDGHGVLRYKIILGDERKVFRADTRQVGDFCFLRIRIKSGSHGALNRELVDRYTLKVKATVRYGNKPQQTTYTHVLVNVLDANDLSPLFYPEVYNVSVSEDAKMHTSVVQVTASDADVGINGEVYYSFSQWTDMFAVHPTTGLVSVTGLHFDRTEYRLDVLAHDRGPVGSRDRYGTAELVIHVVKVNYYAPDVRVEHLPAVVEHASIGTIYALIYVSDRDSGSYGDIQRTEITSGDPDGYLELVEGDSAAEYKLQVAQDLDRESIPAGLNLTIEAQDGGRPPRITEKTVYVKLRDVNDQAPVFAKTNFSANVKECVPVNTPLLFITATDSDDDENGRVGYSIVSGNDHGWLRIDSSTGLLHVASNLDYELEQHLSIVVSARDHGNHGIQLSSSTQVDIFLIDCNDNAPVFANLSRDEVFTDEGSPVGSEVTTVIAVDNDDGDNGRVSYSISNIRSVPFSIDHFTGIVRTKQVLDYETMRRVYSLVIRASDWGTPYRRETEMILKVRLKDINDNVPKFERIDCRGHLSREAPVETELVAVSAIDFDAGDLISYSILDGAADGCFELNPSSGSLRTHCELQSWPGDDHSIVIGSSDGVNNNESMTVNFSLIHSKSNQQQSLRFAEFICTNTSVTDEKSKLLIQARQNNLDADDERLPSSVTVYTQNRHVPRFKASTPKNLLVEEGLPVGHEVLLLTAMDEDHGYNGLLSYVISGGNDGGAFYVDTHTGRLLILNLLDRETQDTYNLNITVSDSGLNPKSSHTLLIVRVTDVNDNAPVFNKQSYSVTIPENTPVNRTIVQVGASDRDQGINASVHYSILSDTHSFAIHPLTGVIRVNTGLDRETIPVYELTVVATDDALDDPLSSSISVTVSLADINDNAPVFIPENYHVRIREDLPVGQVVITITAQDNDLGAAGTVRYSLLEGMDQSFDIDRVSGTIRISRKLDFETKRVYNISARARDRGTPALISKCYIIVEVVDVNENLHAPSFRDFVFEGHVRENQPRNTTVLQLLATDRDVYREGASPADYRVEYSIVGGSGLGFFTIDNTGEIRTHVVLDRESCHHYWLRVLACDHGTVPLCSAVDVFIVIDDVNDNSPLTERPVYKTVVDEGSRSGTLVMRIEGYDPDGDYVTYAITGGDPQGFFMMDPDTGVISTSSRRLDREKQAEHILEVRLTDDGVPSLSSTIRVIVLVGDINDNSPTFLDTLFRVRVPSISDLDHDVPLYRVTAFDLDEGQNGEILYRIRSAKGMARFSIDEHSGMIYARRELNAGDQFEITVEALDNGNPQLEGSVIIMLYVVQRLEESPHKPVFTETSTNVIATIMEDDDSGTMIVIMSAEDEDGDKLWFSITDGNVDDAFNIHPENGNIDVAKSLDWESRPEYNLTVQVTDTIHTAITWVHIQVIDKNEHEPEFTEEVYETDLSEFAPPGTEVLTLHATDRDEDKRLFFTFLSALEQTSLSLFQIDSSTDVNGTSTGVMTSKGRLDREVTSRHIINVMVRDQGTPPKRAVARVIINVTDRNDHAPSFVSRAVEGEVFNTAEIGTTVARVLAVDHDHGVNAEVKYTLVAGNVGSAFNMNQNRGILSVAKPLYTLAPSQYNLVVRASDNGIPSLSSTATITVQVTMPMDAVPMFPQKEYTAEISENQPSGTYIVAVQARSQCSLLYDIISGNELGYFGVNPSSGVIYNLDEIDFELHSFFNLTLSATNLAQAKTFTNVLIHITDKNDNRPSFVSRNYEGFVSERVLPGSVVLDKNNTPLVIKATDSDTNLNSLLHYSVVDTSADVLFDIDPSTGAVRTKVQLDHEVASSYKFSVNVRDSGNPQLTGEREAQVVIHIEDVNDSPPEFSHEEYLARLLAPTYRGVEVLTLSASDADTGVNSSLAYSISGGNERGHFALDPNTGIITVDHDEEMLDFYRLTVEVSDGSFLDEAGVSIGVDLIRENGLSFSQSDYHVEILEGLSERWEVALVQAVGQSLNEHLFFRILNPSELFEIGVTSGVIESTGIALDRESRSNYTVAVEVRDNRVPPRVAHSAVYISVEDVNDNSPVFLHQPYSAIVSIDESIDHVIMKVDAFDADAGQNGAVVFHLMEPHDLFDVRDTGEVVVSGELSLQQQNQEFLLTVVASDQGSEPRMSEATVRIRVMSRATPIFQQLIYTISVPENIPVHSVVTSIMAESPTNGKLIYSITAGDVYDEFNVHFSTGSLIVVEKLDYELIPRYELVVRATDIQTGSFAEATVIIHLEDVNDNAPSFGSLHYFSTVSEAVTIGTSILKVTANDSDTENNAKVFYAISRSEDSPEDASFLQMDGVSGIIHIREKLDHERSDMMKFTAIAVDRGIPALSSSVPVTIYLTDLNDNPPRFHTPVYQVSMSDLATRGQFILSVGAKDEDSSDMDNLAYSIVGGNEGGMFVIGEKTGIIELSNLRKPRIRSSGYLLNVSVTDEVFTTFTSVNITVDASNRRAPTFPSTVIDVDVVENMEPNHPVARVTARDEDPGIYGQLTYWIVNENVVELFRINETSGEIFTLESLDREDGAIYSIAVAARDGGGRVGHMTIRVNIADQGDERPQFKQRQYKACVYAAAEVGTNVLQVEAVDLDLGPNGVLSYGIVNGDGVSAGDLLAVDETSGIITVKQPISDRVGELLQFFIRVEDQSSPPLHVEAPVDIYIMSADDIPPLFPSEKATFFIHEDLEIGSGIATVTAESNDSLAYSLISGESPSTNNPVKFSIDDQGRITVFDDLDREDLDTIELTVRAETRSSPPLVAHTLITVKLMDINDNSPQFQSPRYEVTVSENSEVGTAVIQVVARDKDSGNNGVVSYDFALQDAAMSNIMSIDHNTGWISTLVQLDRETISVYNFSVIATDGGNPSLQTSVRVVVHVTDFNDEAPVFSSSRYQAAVNEDAFPGTIILQVTATDADEAPNNHIFYHIQSGDKLGQFDISENGDVYVSTELDRERVAHYQLEVVASDGAHVAMATVDLTILDANDNDPICDQRMYQVIEAEDVETGTFLLRTSASDRDEPGTTHSEITYSLSGNNSDTFHMQARTGIISIKSPLDRETVPEYHLIVTATDGGGRYCTSEVILTVTDVNDNPPVFSETLYTAHVSEDADVNTLIIRVSASDRDLGLFRKVKYTLRDDNDTFRIDSNSGIVSLLKPVDREVQDVYNVTLFAYDQGTLKMSSSSQLVIYIDDVNDNPPVFEWQVYRVVVPENNTVSESFLTVHATSRDIGINAEIIYSIIEGNEEAMFYVDPQTGDLSNTQALDFETQRAYTLTIQAQDRGEPPLSSLTVVQISVNDSNDNPPVFLQSLYQLTIAEDTPQGTSLTQVEALDADTPPHQQITYLINTGDDLQQFSVDPESGVLTIAKPLDRENISLYQLEVLAINEGYEGLSGTTIIRVNLTDVNDCPPRFVIDNNTAIVQVDMRGRPIPPVSENKQFGIPVKQLIVVAVQSATDAINPSRDARERRSVNSDLDVLIAVYKTPTKLYRGNSLRRRLLEKEEAIEQATGLVIIDMFNDACKKDSCKNGECGTDIVFHEDLVTPIITDSTSFASATFSMVLRCDCEPGFVGPVCGSRNQPCSPNPCRSPQQCREGDDGTTYHCECPEGRSGPDCLGPPVPCDGGSCSEGMTFAGSSYMNWRLSVSTERRLSLSIQIKTMQNNARLMHSVGSVDYSYLEMVDGHIQYRFDLGSGEGLARVDQVKVNDGYWHTVAVRRNGRTVNVIVDNHFTGEGNAPGAHDVLNLDNEVYFGAEVQMVPESIIQGFVGCMKQVTVDGVELPLEGSSDVGVLLRKKDVEMTCHSIFMSGGCSSSPCLNGGTCIPQTENTLLCQCRGRFSGDRCQIDTNPCISMPCLNGGSCEVFSGTYRCVCPRGQAGERCQYALTCQPNPCQHGGTCVNSVSGAYCQCTAGLTGDVCEHDIDECVTTPCHNGGTCINTHGAFICNCSDGYMGDACLDVVSRITSTPFNMTLEEICGIAGVVVAILIIVIIFVVIVRWRRRKKRREQLQKDAANKPDPDDFIYGTNDLKSHQKMNNHTVIQDAHNQHPSPRPPPVPNRPASYTPSAADSVNTLNNFNYDTARNYGSAADELENIGGIREPIEIPDFLQNVDDYEDATAEHALLPRQKQGQRSNWDPNIAENYKDDLKKQSKTMPSENQSTQSLQLLQGGTSAVSLPMSELEDEGQGYHWDTSDWNPSNPLRKIAEVPNRPTLHSNNQSRDSNLHIAQDDYDLTDYGEEFVDSEYVGDSEYCDENEVSDMDEDPNADFREPPNFAEILAMQGDLNYDTEDEPVAPPGPRSYSLHPNQYLPSLNISQGSQEIAAQGGSQDDANANYGVNVGREDDDDVIHYGFTRPSSQGQKLRPESAAFSEISDYNNLDYDAGATSALDAMSVSMGGYTSTNASMSDVSHEICDIDDSEANLSDYENGAGAKDASKSHSHVHTQV